MRLSRLLLVCAATVTAIGIPGIVSAQLPIPLDHYNEYDFAEHGDAGAPTFTLVDEWGETTYTFATYDRLLVPTEQDGEPIFDPALLYTRYALEPGGEPARMISVSNKFGNMQDWMVGESVALLNPTVLEGGGGELQPPIANHYKCYRVEAGPVIGMPVMLADAFGSYSVTLTEPVLWCNPAEKRLESGETYPVVDEMAWLACYYTTFPSVFTPGIPVVITDQFGTVPQDLASRSVLCVPSMKAMPVPTEETSWGALKAVYR